MSTGQSSALPGSSSTKQEQRELKRAEETGMGDALPARSVPNAVLATSFAIYKEEKVGTRAGSALLAKTAWQGPVLHQR